MNGFLIVGQPFFMGKLAKMKVKSMESIGLGRIGFRSSNEFCSNGIIH